MRTLRLKITSTTVSLCFFFLKASLLSSYFTLHFGCVLLGNFSYRDRITLISMGGMVLQLYGEEVWELDFGRTPEIHRNYILKKKDDS